MQPNASAVGADCSLLRFAPPDATSALCPSHGGELYSSPFYSTIAQPSTEWLGGSFTFLDCLSGCKFTWVTAHHSAFPGGRSARQRPLIGMRMERSGFHDYRQVWIILPVDVVRSDQDHPILPTRELMAYFWQLVPYFLSTNGYVDLNESEIRAECP